MIGLALFAGLGILAVVTSSFNALRLRRERTAHRQQDHTINRSDLAGLGQPGRGHSPDTTFGGFISWQNVLGCACRSSIG